MAHGLARQVLLSGAALVVLAGSAFAGPAVPRVTLSTPTGTAPLDLFPVCDEGDIDKPDSDPSPQGETDPGSQGENEPVPGNLIVTPDLPQTLLVNCHNQTDAAGPKAKPEATRAVTRAIGEGRDLCSFVPSEARIGCIANQFREIADNLPRGGDYAPVRKALRDGARELEAITRANAAPATPRKRYEVVPPDGGARQSSGPITEVAPDRAAAANRAAAAVIEQTQTVLLRSAQNSRERMVHYQEIATAIDSTKVLLRSA